MIEKLTEYRKAIAAFLVPALVVLGAAFADGAVSVQEWIAVAIAALGTSAIVGAVPNALTVTQRADLAQYVRENGIDGL